MIFTKAKNLCIILALSALMSMMASGVMAVEETAKPVSAEASQPQSMASFAPAGCADVNGDGSDNLGDVTCLIEEAFIDGCDDYVHDVNGDGVPDIIDITLMIRWMFWGGSAPC